jgi:hypothetical protein
MVLSFFELLVVGCLMRPNKLSHQSIKGIIVLLQ